MIALKVYRLAWCGKDDNITIGHTRWHHTRTGLHELRRYKASKDKAHLYYIEIGEIIL